MLAGIGIVSTHGCSKNAYLEKLDIIPIPRNATCSYQQAGSNNKEAIRVNIETSKKDLLTECASCLHCWGNASCYLSKQDVSNI